MFAASTIRLSNTTIASPYQARVHLPTAVEIYCKWRARPASDDAFCGKDRQDYQLNFLDLRRPDFQRENFSCHFW